MMRPTSLWRSCTRKIVSFPEGISESIISSGNSTSCRITNSRNCFTNSTLFEVRALSLLVAVGRLEVRSIFADRADFFSVGPEQPIPIIRPGPDEIPVLLDKETILVFARWHDLQIVAGKQITFLAIGRIHDMDRAGSRPGRRHEIQQFAVGRKLQILESANDRLHFLGVTATDEQRRFLSIDPDLPELRWFPLLRAGRDFLAVDFADKRHPFAVGSQERIRIAAARSQRRRLSRFVGKLDVAVFDGNALGERWD